MKIADYRKRRRALEMSGALAQPNREKPNAHEDHEVRPEDVQGSAREGAHEEPRQGEGRSPGEEGAAGEVSTAPGTMFNIDRPEKPYLQGQQAPTQTLEEILVEELQRGLRGEK